MAEVGGHERSALGTSRRRRRRQPQPLTERTSQLWSWGLLAAAVVGSALALGALHRATLVVVASAVFASAAVALRGGGRVPGPAWVFLALAGYTALQALPLPAAWVTALSPHTAAVWQRAFELAPGAGGWMSISLDRGATCVEVLKWAMYGAGFVSAAHYGATRDMVRGLMLPLVAALLVAVVTLGHGLSAATTIYGFYEPTFRRSIWHMGPLLNPNHLASYLNFGTFCGLGLLASRARVVPAWAMGLAVAFLIPNAVVAGSRGGVGGLVVGVVAFLVLLPKRRYADPQYGPEERRVVLAGMTTVMILSIGFASLLASDETAKQLYETNVDKLKLLSWCGALVADHPWLGIGRGAFESVFTAYRSGASNEIYTHPENLPVQWVGEWGIPVAVAAVAALSWTLRPRRLGARWSATGAGVLAALAAIVAQNFVDFGLEVPAIALCVVVSLGVCWGHAARRRRPSEPLARRFRITGVVAMATLAVLGGTAVLGSGFRPLVYERASLAQRYEALGDADRDGMSELRHATREMMLAHPAEPYFYRMGALLAWRSSEDPIPWLQRALERGPWLGRTHILVARVLASRGAVRQALLGLRLAATYDPNLVPSTAQAAASWTRDYSDLMRAVPEGEVGIRTLSTLGKLLSADAFLHEKVLVELVARNPQAKDSLEALASYYLRQLELPGDAGRCGGAQRAPCAEDAERLVAKLEQLAPAEGDTILLRTRLLKLMGAGAEALAHLKQHCPSLSGAVRTRCLHKRMEMAASSKDTLEFASAADEFVKDGCVDSEQCAVVLEKVADLSAQLGDWRTAFAHYDRAARERPEDRLWIKVARAGGQVGAFTQVGVALRRIRRRERFEPEYSRLMKLAAERGRDLNLR
jgi:tetratricopeptide (TPR) repeat protein